MLATDALQRLEDCLSGYAERVRAFAPGKVVVAGTSAVRDAPNRSQVAEIVKRLLGAPLTVLTGEEEAACAYRGATLATATPPRAVVDIGGASTEVIAGGSAGPSGLVSFDIGAVRCTVGAMAQDPPGVDAAAALSDRIEEIVARGAPEMGASSAPVLGVAGTFTTLAAMEIGHYSRDAVDGFRLSARELADRARSLATLSVAERRELPGLDAARAEAIGAGAVIASAVVDALGAPEVTVSERDLLDGLALGAGDLPQSLDFS